MRLVVEPAADREQVAEPPSPDELGAFVAEPVEQRGVDLGDGAVEQCRQVSAGCVVVEVVDVVLQQRRERRVGRRGV
jgi:hypothetical protein